MQWIFLIWLCAIFIFLLWLQPKAEARPDWRITEILPGPEPHSEQVPTIGTQAAPTLYNKKTAFCLRVFGGSILLFNLGMIGLYKITGILALLMTVGFAVAFELFVVRPCSQARKVK